ncbi:MAG: aminotransferase class I/II-fold pyridoxal phosphate-dependent enzyme, partial [Candidatus Micrarchaeota archaeon]|nr:aminotransferase class I/II-fold pyridoxal phosphate-dependent enzyme [Candidatus Micrarchaeota archaeon]
MPTLDSLLLPEIQALKEKELDWKVYKLEGPSTPHAVVNGKKVLMLGTNNYLGLSNHPAVKEAAIEAVKKYGAGSGSVRTISGTMDLHVRLEETIARFKRSPAAIYFQTGFAANAGSLPAILQDGDLVISDELNHGSIIDGVRLSKAERTVYKHNDMDDLASKLEAASKASKYKKILIVTDGVFSMDGDIAPLDRIQKLAQAYGAFIYVDDAHGDGVLGSHGRGIVDHFGLEGKVELEMGTFSKAFGVVGGLIACSSTTKEYLHNKARSYLLSGSAPPATVASCIAVLELLEKDDTPVKKLWENTAYFKEQLKGMGFDTGNSGTPITPIMIGDSAKAKAFSAELFSQGVFALPIVFPMVAQGKARVRTQVRADFSREDLDFALKACENAGHKL